MASVMALPHEVYLSEVFQTLQFLKNERNGVTVFDPAAPDVDQTQFSTEDYSATLCGPFKQDTPSNAPTPRGTGFTMRDFFIQIMLETQLIFDEELDPSYSSTFILSLCFLRNREAATSRFGPGVF